MRVRQSTLGGFDKCALSMQYDIEHHTFHGSSVRALGTAYHAGLELWYDPLRSLGGDPEDIPFVIHHARQMFDQTVDMAPSHDSEHSKTPGTFTWDEKVPDHETAYRLLELMLTEYLTSHRWPDGTNVLAVEWSFSQDWRPGHLRVGSVDMVIEEAGWILGVDHKTAGRMWPKGKEHRRKQNQSNWYTAALIEEFPDAKGYRFIYEIMTYAGKFERRIADVTPESIRAFDNKAESVVGLYTGMRAAGMDLPANPASTLCNEKWCDHWSFCPYGAALDT